MIFGVPDLYVPFMQYPSLNEGRDLFDNRNASFFQVYGLLGPGTTLEEADAAVATVFRRLEEEYPESNEGRTAGVREYGPLPSPARGPTGMFLAVLMGFVGLILLITCANVAGMFLARATGRRKEIAIRLSTGSGRGQLLRHLLTEYLLVFLMGGVGGVVLAVVGLRALMSIELPAPFPVEIQLAPDGGVFLFAVFLTLTSGLVFGLLPARQALNIDLLSTLKDEGARAGSSEGKLRRGFVSAQVAASLVLLVASGLFLRTLQRAGEIETGFEAEGAYLTFLDLSTEGFGEDDGGLFQQEILDHFAQRPWVESVALSQDLPLDMSARGTSVVPEGWQSTPEEEYFGIGFNGVTPDYFRTLNIPVLEGRTFNDGDREGSDQVAVVSRAFVAQAWPGESALGRTMEWGGSGEETLTVVGVVEDVQNMLLTDAPRPFVYRPMAQMYGPQNNLVVRSSAEMSLVAREVQQGLRELDPNISLSPVIDLQSYTAVGILPQRIAALSATTLGLLALLLSGMGVYGIMAYSVARRTRELGIRAALGAEPNRVLRSVILGGFRMALPGLVVGILLAVGVGVLLRSLLLGVHPLDPAALLGVAVTVAGMVLAGTLVPARRASHVDPAEALRQD
jgi:putative ABC transport system permease protein